jgi:protein-tyrosine phosphatase
LFGCAIGRAIGATLIGVLLYDQPFFRPLLAMTPMRSPRCALRLNGVDMETCLSTISTREFPLCRGLKNWLNNAMKHDKEQISVIFVCMGNICRSPTAETVFRRYVEEAGLQEHILIDSAGTHDYHIGDEPDARTQRAARQRGYDMSKLRGRQVVAEDFTRFDYVLAMDESNLGILRRLRPRESQSHLGLFLEFAEHHQEREVPDPYYGGTDGFERVLDMVEDAAEGLLRHIRRQHLQELP